MSEDLSKTVDSEINDIGQMNKVLDAHEVVMDMDAYTDIFNFETLTAEDTVCVDGFLDLKQLEALVTLFKDRMTKAITPPKN